MGQLIRCEVDIDAVTARCDRFELVPVSEADCMIVGHLDHRWCRIEIGHDGVDMHAEIVDEHRSSFGADARHCPAQGR